VNKPALNPAKVPGDFSVPVNSIPCLLILPSMPNKVLL